MLYNYNNTNKTKYLCDCDCGNKNILRSSSLSRKYTQYTSCGCAKADSVRESIGLDITNKKFGRLFVKQIIWDRYDVPMVKCDCDCGTIDILLRKSDVQSGHTQSCGCLHKEIISKTNYKNWDGYISDYGVKAIKPLYKNNTGQWIWEWECPLCHNKFEMLPAKIANNHTTSCGCKIQSNGEQLIKNILDENDIKYIPQYKFENCKNKYVLKFDFAIFKDDEVFCLFEYDGLQHFKPIEFFGGEKGFQNTQERDKIKNDYCLENHIPLYRFKYDEDLNIIKNRIMNIIYP